MTPTFIMMLTLAVCQVESGSNKTAINVSDGGSASYGYCQVKLATARMLGFKIHPGDLRFNSAKNVEVAAEYLRTLLVRYGGDLEQAVCAYNRGSCTKEQARRSPYVRRVFAELSKHMGGDLNE